MEVIKTPPEQMPKEMLMHQRFTGWVAAHNDRYDGDITDNGYDPENPKIGQRIDECKTEPVCLRGNLEKDEALEMLRQVSVQMMGSEATVQALVDDFKNKPAFDDNSSQTITEAVVGYLDNDQTVGLFSDHAEDLSDIIKVTGGLNLAIGEEYGTEYMDKFNIWVNKLMTREDYRGYPVEFLVGLAGWSRWVMPDSDSARLYGFEPDDEISMHLNAKALRGFNKESSVGKVEALVPGGSGMTPNLDANGQLESLSAPPMESATESLLGRMHGLLPVSLYKNQWRIGYIQPMESIKELPSHQRKARIKRNADNIARLLADQTADIVGLPVILEDKARAENY
jgi:hypothetical protein